MKLKAKSKPQVKLSRRKVEDGIATYLHGGTCTSDVEFGEAAVVFRDRKQYERGLSFKTFSINGVSYTQAAKDEKKMTITYLFH